MKNTIILLSSLAVSSFGATFAIPNATFAPGGTFAPTGTFVVAANGTDILADLTVAYTFSASTGNPVIDANLSIGFGNDGNGNDTLNVGEDLTIGFAIASGQLQNTSLDIVSFGKGRTGTVSVADSSGTIIASQGPGSNIAATGIQDTLTFTGLTGFSGINGFTIDVTNTPEPTSAALLGLGGLALVARRRR